MATVLDIGILHYFDFIFPMLIVFAIVFAILQKTKIIDNPAMNSIIAVAAAFTLLLSRKAIEVINFMIPWFAIAIIFLILMVLLFRTMGAKEEMFSNIVKDKLVYWSIIGIAIVIFAVALGNVLGQDALEASQSQGHLINATSGSSSAAYQQNVWSIISNPKILGMVIVFAIAVFAIALLTG